MDKQCSRILVCSALFILSPPILAKVSDTLAQKLGQELTPMGAELAANEDKSIPAWTGKVQSNDQGLEHQKSGDQNPASYKQDKRLFTITAENQTEYKNHLSEGVIALLKKYPNTFELPIYPSRRAVRFSTVIEQRTRWNATHTELNNGIDGLRQYTGGAPFPIPSNAAEVMWNARIIHPTPSMVGTMDDIAIYPDNKRQLRRQAYIGEFPFSYADNPIGKVDDDIDVNAAYVHVTVEQPKRQKGQMTVVHEALDQIRNDRKAWVYIPGSRRVRRAPTVGYDTPDGPGGLVTVDDSLGFNGAMDRYQWHLIGKKEMYIPYHAYRFDEDGISYEKLLLPGHANPEYMRFEKHRVWIVEAELKPNQRHIYSKRRFYIDEDSWQIVLLESYDGRNVLWRVGILNTRYDFTVQGYVARAQMFHDLQSGAYVATRLFNQTSPMKFTEKPKGKDYYSPASLRKMGR
jgi:hypothetical protein